MTSSPHATPPATAAPHPSPDHLPTAPIDRWLLGAVAALLVATPLVATESAAEYGTGCVFLLLWMLVATAWAVSRCVRAQAPLRWAWIDLVVALFVGWTMISGLVMLSQGHGRLILNMTWQWIGFGVAYALLRQLVVQAGQARALAALAIALAVGLSVYGLYQHQVAFPELRAAYLADPDGMLTAAGVVAPAGSPQRKQFEDRLNSTEPIATFALANSLAGYLAPWLIVLGGGLLERRWPSRSWIGFVAGSGLALLVVGTCLILTKSRSAYLAVILGLLGLAVSRWRVLGWRWLIVGGLVLGSATLIAAVALATGALDWQVISEAPLSVRYRLEYWTSTVQMIADYPWFGCGPGSFQDFYTAYKLPQASETVADPHNFVLELAATMGIPAAALFLTALGMYVFETAVRSGGASPEPPPAPEESLLRPILIGGVLGFFLAYPTGLAVDLAPDMALLWTTFPAMAGTLGVLWPWVRHGQLPGPLVTVALGTLLIQLLAAGGISISGVGLSVWLLLALGLQSSPVTRLWAAGPLPRFGLAVASFALVVVSYLTMYQPVLTSQTRVAASRSSLDMAQVEADLKAAAGADPFWSQPVELLVELQLQKWLIDNDSRAAGEFESSVREALARDPHSSQLYRQVGQWWTMAFAAVGERKLLERAAAANTEAIRLYPTSAILHAQQAWTLVELDRRDEARRAADEAWRLDQLHPHAEQKLRAQMLYVSGRGSAPPNAEEWVQQLRQPTN